MDFNGNEADFLVIPIICKVIAPNSYCKKKVWIIDVGVGAGVCKGVGVGIGVVVGVLKVLGPVIEKWFATLIKSYINENGLTMKF